ncbi:Uncharacterised protein [Mycolicibacterium flavescens]|nr:Uncharacterised protein [Mycolicibacterium flavescens]
MAEVGRAVMLQDTSIVWAPTNPRSTRWTNQASVAVRSFRTDPGKLP